MSGDKIYAYGVIEADSIDVSTDGVEGESDVYTVSHRTHAAVVSDIDTLDPEESDENARAHDDVLREVMTAGDGRAVVPMRFGMVFESERALKNVLRNSRAELTGSLRRAAGHEEVGIKVLVPEDGVADADSVRESIETELADHAADVADGDLFSDRLLLNNSYLVERDERESFDDAVDAVREAHPDLTVQYSGPWAPYSFVDFHIKAEA
ncbi:GvpL/GvpF family gas vesicle protein [Halomicroarcula limicola]|uniref:GvpL/GvpF family gas vesicle protein n=1 Tax=Haloarcula limicola TaxID=1429915 RepID=A0A8J7YCD3_9EURY|nr:GvpL/GvpF family gas vesicle protein [Halomicroarcula limicola]MBV0926056.1 GvpL/GvpF family gas vesicle protein [Halomicroarcula limicola]